MDLRGHFPNSCLRRSNSFQLCDNWLSPPQDKKSNSISSGSVRQQHSDDMSKGYGTPLVGSKLVGLNLLRRSELDTTVMELAAMAAAAKIGFKNP